MRLRLALLSAAAALSFSVQAHDYQAGGLRLVHPNTPVPNAAQDVIGVYLVIENTSGTPDRLVSARSDLAQEATLHTATPGGTGMHAAAGLTVQPNSRIELSAKGPHIMLSGLERPLKAGDRFPLRLVFERAGAIQVDVMVGSVKQEKASAAHGGH